MMMKSSLLVRGTIAGLVVSLACFTGCPSQNGDGGNGGQDTGNGGDEVGPSDPVEPAGRVSTAKAEDVDAAKKLLDELGPNAEYTLVLDGVMTEIAVKDGSTLSADDITLFGKLSDLEQLQIYNYRELNDEMASQLAGLKNLKTLALTNSVIGDSTVEMIAKSFPNLTNLDLSYNTNMTNSAMKVICELGKLDRLTLIQNRFNDLGTDHLSKLKNLRVLDIRGNMEAGNMTMEVLAALPKLVALKHRSTAVDDFGMEYLAQSKTLKTLLMQDFVVTGQAGQHLAAIDTLTELEVFRCQMFDSQGVLALKGMKLTRLKLRDLPMVDDYGLEALDDLPELKRLELHELSVSDTGLEHLEALKSLEVLDIWFISQMTDATVDVIAKLPNLKELSIKETGVTDAAIDKLLAMPSLKSLAFKDNGSVTANGLKRLSGKEWDKLDIGSTE